VYILNVTLQKKEEETNEKTDSMDFCINDDGMCDFGIKFVMYQFQFAKYRTKK